ncbi:MAG: phosphoribosylanthranilate isomerase [Armatimonadetes bacterium]|nr:phosphoribosylanthranilate isomerase [Armatimonadota bacterium]
METVRVKICGITNLDDALTATDAGADALGFNFVPAAPAARQITPEVAARIIARLPPFITCVGLVADQDLAPILGTCPLDALQYYGNEPPEALRALGVPRVIKAFRVADEADITRIEPYIGSIAAALLDARVPGRLGGTGRAFPWELAVAAQRYGVPIILAGGLTPANVAEAVRIARPYAVDVASGVEAAPGHKDPEKVRAFIAAVRSALL